jgi:hypothetical protein
MQGVPPIFLSIVAPEAEFRGFRPQFEGMLPFSCYFMTCNAQKAVRGYIMSVLIFSPIWVAIGGNAGCSGNDNNLLFLGS